MSRLLRLTLLSVAVIACAHSLSAQMPSLFVFPTNGTDNVDPSAAIVIRAPAPIEPASISFNYPDAERGIMVAPTPTVMLIGENGIPLKGTYTLTDERTLTFRPRPLAFGTRYRCVVSGITLVGGFAPLPPEEIQFTTARDVPHIVSCSLEGADLITCDAPIWLRFTRSIAEDLPDVMRAITLTTSDMPNWPMPIEHGFALSEDGKTLTFTPRARWPVGQPVELHAAISGFTGDVLDDRRYTTVVRSASKVTVTPRAVDGRAVPTSLIDAYRAQEHVAVHGITVDLTAIDDLGARWRFVRWESPLLTLTNDRHLRIDLPCERLAPTIPIEAIVERVDTIEVDLVVDSGGAIHVYGLDNVKIATVTDSMRLQLHDGQTDVRLIAQADTTFAFASWLANGTSLHGAKAPAIVVKPTTTSSLISYWQNSNRIVKIKPSFRKVSPTSEHYVLRGFIQDEDATPGYNVDEAVVFTTPRVFEDAAPGDRTICIQAARCWEIIGYTIAADGIRVDVPSTNEYCVTAAMMDPENTVTFHVRRRNIQLRIEKVLLASDDPNDIIEGKRPHPETYIRVELKTTNLRGGTVWTSLPELNCSQNGRFFSPYELHCGDEIRIRTRGSRVRGQDWAFWDARDRYVIPNRVEQVNDEVLYTVVIDRDIARFDGTTCEGQPTDEPEIRMRGCFQQKFGIDAISVRVRTTNGTDRGSSNFSERWLDPLTYRERLPEEPIGGRQIEYVPRHGTIVKVRFNQPLDMRTIFEGGMQAKSYDNTLVTEPLRKDLDFTVASSDDDHITFEPVDGSPITTVVFSVADPTTTPRLQALHGGTIDMKCLTSIKSLRGQPLLASARFILQSMELPAYGLFLRDITYDFDGDNDFIFANNGEIYHVMFGGDLAHEKIYASSTAFKRVPDCSEQQGVTPGECTLEHSDKDGPQKYNDMMLWMQPFWMDRTDHAWWYVSTYDEDCKDENDCFVNRVHDLLDIAREKAETYNKKNEDGSIDWESAIGDIIDLGTRFIQGLLPVDEQDDHLGYGNFIETAGNWWGVKTATYPKFMLDHSNTRYHLRPRLFTLRSVVR